jgi:site-specific recombinase XerD
MIKRLKTTFKDLHEIGYKLPNIRNVKQKHIESLVHHWKENGLSAGTIKNRMSNLRFVCESFGRSNVIKTNKEYGIENRSYVLTGNKAVKELNLEKIRDKQLQLSLRFQKEFGLRREECLKIKPKQAFITTPGGSNMLKLQASWTKGGIERNIPIEKESQLELIRYAISAAGKKSLIPNDKTYIERRNQYDDLTHRAGLRNLHGLRHAYAQKRYYELTNRYANGQGWQCPIAGGPKRYQMTKAQKVIDKKVRLKISNELGHSRIAIVKNYCG